MADLILIIHVLWVAVVVGMVPAILLGAWRGWKWVRIRWVRIGHLLMMVIVALEALLEITCPLTSWEHELRGGTGKPDSFIARLVHTFLYYDLPPQFFLGAYLIFTFVILLLYRVIPPRNTSNTQTIE